MDPKPSKIKMSQYLIMVFGLEDLDHTSYESITHFVKYFIDNKWFRKGINPGEKAREDGLGNFINAYGSLNPQIDGFIDEMECLPQQIHFSSPVLVDVSAPGRR